MPTGQDRSEEEGFFHPRAFREDFLTDGDFGRSGDLLSLSHEGDTAIAFALIQ